MPQKIHSLADLFVNKTDVNQPEKSLATMRTNCQPDRSPPRKEMIPLRMVTDDRSGFTLVELLLVVGIISVLSMVALAAFSEFRNKAKIYRCMGEIRGLEKQITAWATEKGSYPASLADIGRDTLRDPWGNPYIYSPPTRKDFGLPINTDFDIYSKGTNSDTVVASIRDPASGDDIIRGRDGSYVGLAIDF